MNNKELEFFIENNLNVLMRGHAGVGKTARITAAFDRHNLNWRYYSAATMDPWVDFIGIPKETKDAAGNAVLDLIRPRDFAHDEVEALFFDEFNRAPKKVRNAVMELIQFKSINGKKFNNLKFIWAAINPNKEDEISYDVEDLDPAQLDRFHIHIDVPYVLDQDYFTERYGAKVFNSTKEWWETMPEAIRLKVSPRRVDYALEIFNKGGDIHMVLPAESNPVNLVKVISDGMFTERLKVAVRKKNLEGFLNCPNTISEFVESYDKVSPEVRKDCLKVIAGISKELLSLLVSKPNPEMKQDIIDLAPVVVGFKDTLEAISKETNNQELRKIVIRDLFNVGITVNEFGNLDTTAQRRDAVSKISQEISQKVDITVDQWLERIKIIETCQSRTKQNANKDFYEEMETAKTEIRKILEQKENVANVA